MATSGFFTFYTALYDMSRQNVINLKKKIKVKWFLPLSWRQKGVMCYYHCTGNCILSSERRFLLFNCYMFLTSLFSPHKGQVTFLIFNAITLQSAPISSTLSQFCVVLFNSGTQIAYRLYVPFFTVRQSYIVADITAYNQNKATYTLSL